jgi:hypothetical protein
VCSQIIQTERIFSESEGDRPGDKVCPFFTGMDQYTSGAYFYTVFLLYRNRHVRYNLLRNRGGRTNEGEPDMKVLMINGSPDRHGCIHTAMEIAAEEFASKGIETEEMIIGNKELYSVKDFRKSRNIG